MRSLCRDAGEGERGVHGWRFGDFAALVPFGERDFRLRIAKFSWRELSRELRDAGLTRGSLGPDPRVTYSRAGPIVRFATHRRHGSN